ncbi:hypothetical protein [Flavobacterium hungaricum]|nr:hypothetical protein [Flavobacterium hungaricum]
MKKVGLLFVLVFSLVSCSNDDVKMEGFPSLESGRWELAENISLVPYYNSISTPQYKETYVFDKGKFSKTRIKDNKTTTVSGTYTTVTTATQMNLELTYTAANDLIESCTVLKESLYINKEGKLNNNLKDCDPTLLVYTKLK